MFSFFASGIWGGVVKGLTVVIYCHCFCHVSIASIWSVGDTTLLETLGYDVTVCDSLCPHEQSLHTPSVMNSCYPIAIQYDICNMNCLWMACLLICWSETLRNNGWSSVTSVQILFHIVDIMTFETVQDQPGWFSLQCFWSSISHPVNLFLCHGIHRAIFLHMNMDVGRNLLPFDIVFC